MKLLTFLCLCLRCLLKQLIMSLYVTAVFNSIGKVFTVNFYNFFLFDKCKICYTFCGVKYVMKCFILTPLIDTEYHSQRSKMFTSGYFILFYVIKHVCFTPSHIYKVWCCQNIVTSIVKTMAFIILVTLPWTHVSAISQILNELQRFCL
jgi:hypothetical protein